MSNSFVLINDNNELEKINLNLSSFQNNLNFNNNFIIQGNTLIQENLNVSKDITVSEKLYFNTQGTAYMNWSNGQVISVGNFSNISDERVKKNPILANNELLAKAFDNINIYKYQYQPQFAIDSGLDYNTEHYGWIAQNVKTYTENITDQFANISNGISTFPNKKINYTGEKLNINDLITINKNDLTIVLWSKVKEQEKIINNLITRIENLEKNNN